ncbi:MAG: acyl carrier protein [Pseudomonadota bacterium]
MDQHNKAVWTEDRLIGVIRDLAKENELPDHLITGKILGLDTVETLGIDSIGAVALIDRLEAEAGVLLPDDFLEFEESVEQIALRLNAL